MSPAETTTLSPDGSISRAAASSFAASRPLIATLAPSATNRAAASLPMPDPPPVTATTLPSNLFMLLSLSIDR